MDFKKLVQHSRVSNFGLWKLNFLLQRFVPFNKPHGLKVVSFLEEEVLVNLPYRKNNLNHLKGLHACGLATAAEFASGLLLLYHLDPKKYRLIMESIEVSYSFQGKTEAFASYAITKEEIEKEILKPLKESGMVYKTCEIELKDQEGNLLCLAKTNWQIKSWEKVKTKV